MNNVTVHPYELNSGVYNFFFHPFHKASENRLKTLISVITNVVVTIFSIFLWQIPFLIINKLDNAKINQWRSKVIAEKLRSYLSHFPETVPLRIAETARIHHGASTCFIAASIQLCRQLPSVRKMLNCEIQRKAADTDDRYELRKKIHHHLKTILSQTENNYEVSGKAIEEFHSILHQYAEITGHSIPKQGHGGCVRSIFTCFLEVLSIPNNMNIYETQAMPEENLVPHLKYHVCTSSLIKPEFTFKVQEDLTKAVKYRLVGAARFGTGHAVAYIKDLNNPSDQFVFCDDEAPHKIVQKIEHIASRAINQFFAVYVREV